MTTATQLAQKSKLVPVPFTQYLLPHGRKRDVFIEMPHHIALVANEFIRAGGRYEAEILTTGHVSLTAHLMVDDEPTDVEIEVVPNGPGMKEVVERLILRSIDHLPASAREPS